MYQQNQKVFAARLQSNRVSVVFESVMLQVWEAWKQLGLPALQIPLHAKVVEEIGKLDESVHSVQMQLQLVNWDNAYRK